MINHAALGFGEGRGKKEKLRSQNLRYPMRGKRIPSLMQTHRTTIAPSGERIMPAG